ncbi:hypothetical protein ElyMa_001548200 [Elysia marginata]|uniref:Uncharacterized protein n=1 Tax=Elysia marginata TaxID=1093978 RepID=A0AAV4J9X1_9GAST|nr:hypothetical protein ElyMa_001548200 [Elysia marginata]
MVAKPEKKERRRRCGDKEKRAKKNDDKELDGEGGGEERGRAKVKDIWGSQHPTEKVTHGAEAIHPYLED